jgi:hypothetical protein
LLSWPPRELVELPLEVGFHHLQGNTSGLTRFVSFVIRILR